MTIELSKTYRTRDGRPVRIYAVDGGETAPVHGAFFDKGQWIAVCWGKDGMLGVYGGAVDLIEARPMRRVKGWLNIYKAPACGTIHDTRKRADETADPTDPRIACIEIDVETEDLSK